MKLDPELSEIMKMMASGETYDDNDAALNRRRRSANKLIAAYCEADDSGEKINMLKELFSSVEGPAIFIPPFSVEFGFFTKIGRNFFANRDFILYDCAPVTIGNDVRIGPRVAVIASNHSFDMMERRTDGIFAKPIVIGDDVWIGANAVILPGASIGSGSIIGAGSVVTGSIPENVIAAGVPCRVIRSITDADKTGYVVPERFKAQN